MPKVLGSLLKMNGKMHSQFILVYALYAVSRLAGMLHGYGLSIPRSLHILRQQIAKF
jgi:hypothetical protein